MSTPFLPLERPAWAAGLLSRDAWTVLIGELIAAIERHGLRYLGPTPDGALEVAGATDASSGEINLGSLARIAATAPPSAWAGMAERFVLAFADLPDSLGGRIDRGRLRLRVVHRAWLPEPGFVVGPLAGELVIALALDRPDSVVHLPVAAAATALGLEREAVLALARDNLARAICPRLLRVNGGPAEVVDLFAIEVPPEEEESWAASAILLLAELVGLEPDPGALVMVPTPAHCALVPLDRTDPIAAISFLASAAMRFARDAQRPLSTDLYYWDADGLEPVSVGLLTRSGAAPNGPNDGFLVIKVGARFARRHPASARAFVPPSGRPGDALRPILGPTNRAERRNRN